MSKHPAWVTNPNVAHVYRKPNREASNDRSRNIGYGEALGGYPFTDVIVHDLPRNRDEYEWFCTELFCRMTPGAAIYFND